MKLKAVLAALFIGTLNLVLSAHEGGHGLPTKTWQVNDEVLVAEFVKYEAGKVYLMNVEHEVSAYELSAFAKSDRESILAIHQKRAAFNHSILSSPTESSPGIYRSIGFVFGGLAVIFSLFFSFVKKRKFRFVYAYGVLVFAIIVVAACKEQNAVSTTAVPVPANDVDFMSSLFERFEGVQASSDDDWFYISSIGLPAHKMMIGITNWQQQVPIRQDYTGNNSWAIPIQPELADDPLSTQTNLLKGAIAVAVNGIPIFNPLNNRGEDANAIGELDQWGGHCGRADDYHYHLPPVHLQATVGEDNPIAYAVDGFPIYGQTIDQLDEFLGKFNEDGSYQYHTIAEYPYFIAGMRGRVTLDPNTTAPENQVIPQARTSELRPATAPLPGAVITDFSAHNEHSYSLMYSLQGESYTINYSWDDNGLYTYEFVDPEGSSRVETYHR